MVVKARSFAFFVRCVTAVVQLILRPWYTSFYGRRTRVWRPSYNEPYCKSRGAKKRYRLSDTFKI